MKLTPLKLELIVKNVPQRRIAETAEVDKSYISRIVNGTQKPSAKVVEALATYGITIEGAQHE